jgi:hypothetical protein
MQGRSRIDLYCHEELPLENGCHTRLLCDEELPDNGDSILDMGIGQLRASLTELEDCHTMPAFPTRRFTHTTYASPIDALMDFLHTPEVASPISDFPLLYENIVLHDCITVD